MGYLDPQLRQGLVSHEDSTVRDSCSLLDDVEPCGDDRPCRDGFCALLFYITAGVLIFFAASASDQLNFADYASAREKLNEEAFQAAMKAICVGGIVSFILAQCFLRFANACTEVVVWAALLFGPLSLIVAGVSMLPSAPVGTAIGFLSISLGVCMASCTCCCWKHLIPFTVLLIQTLISVMQDHFAMIFITLAGSILCVAWNLLCVVGCLALYMVHRSNNYQHDAAEDNAVYFAVCFIFLWGSMVASNTCHVACCGIFSRWYFGKEHDSPVAKSLKVAFITSFGSICLGSFAVAFIRATEMLLKKLEREAAEDNNPVVCVLLCLTRCVVNCIGDILEWFNEFAYVQCAVRGHGYLDAVKATYALCTFSGCQGISAASLVSTVMTMGALLCSILGGAMSYVIFCGLMTDQMGVAVFGSIVGVFGYIIAIMMALAVLQPLQSGATTLIVCWAERPGDLARSHPQLASEFASRGQSWMEIDFAGTPALQPQPDAARNVAAVPMMEMQQLPGSKQLSVTVPANVMSGQVLQVRTPEGQLLQVQVPAGARPGTTFLASY